MTGPLRMVDAIDPSTACICRCTDGLNWPDEQAKCHADSAELALRGEVRHQCRHRLAEGNRIAFSRAFGL
jgi:hypothetical protein